MLPVLLRQQQLPCMARLLLLLLAVRLVQLCWQAAETAEGAYTWIT
jgi:hypothetical protein